MDIPALREVIERARPHGEIAGLQILQAVGNEGIFDCNDLPGGGSVTRTILALTQPSSLWRGDPDDPLGYQPVLGDGLVELLATGQPSGTSPPCNVTASVDGPTSTMSWTVPTS